jgi:tRNA (guanine37-N1)-methyltransferase
MKIQVLTIFPELFQDFTRSSLIGKAQERNLITLSVTDIRSFAEPPHFCVDDSPYGGGAGMVMKPEPLAKAIEDAKSELPRAKVVLLSPSGTRFSQQKAVALSGLEELILVCGRYEGVDERVVELYVDEEISIGDYVLMGGELPAMVVIEATVRLIDNVIGNSESLAQESFNTSDEGLLLEAPQYTRPPEFKGHKVPEVLLSGNHQKIQEWRRNQARQRTAARRPELLCAKKDTK